MEKFSSQHDNSLNKMSFDEIQRTRYSLPSLGDGDPPHKKDIALMYRNLLGRNRSQRLVDGD